MRLHSRLFVHALFLVIPALMPAYASPSEATPDDEESFDAQRELNEVEEDIGALPPPAPVPTPLHLTRKGKVYASAYSDAYSILSANNPCSQFFSGAAAAIEVLNKLSDQLKTVSLPDTSTAMTMFGETTSVVNNETGHSYRLFEKAMLNSNGPFYKRRTFASERFVPNIGSFEPNTREARVAILLHELGHLIKGPDGKWLLPDDGGNADRSIKNTRIVEAKCGDQIRELK